MVSFPFLVNIYIWKDPKCLEVYVPQGHPFTNECSLWEHECLGSPASHTCDLSVSCTSLQDWAKDERLDYSNVVWSFFLKILLPHSLTVSLCTNTSLRVCFRWRQIKETLKSKNSIRASPWMYENRAGTAVSGLSGSLDRSGQTSALP